jgi:hypothetical protein
MRPLPDTASGDLFCGAGPHPRPLSQGARGVEERPGALGCQVEIAARMAVAMEQARERGLTRERIAERMSALLGEKISKETLDGYVAPSHRDREIPFKRAMAFDAALGEDVLLGLFAEKRGGRQVVSADDADLLAWARLHHEERRLAARKKALEAVLDQRRR